MKNTAFMPEAGELCRMKYVLPLLLFFMGTAVQAQVLRTRTVMLMGSRFDITVSAGDSITSERHIDTIIAEVRRIEYLISDWIDTTQVSRVNRNAGIQPVRVDGEVLGLTVRALELSRLTNGAFDISFAAMEKIWRFDGTMTEMPSPEAVRKARENVGYRDIVVDTVQSTVFLRKKGMKIGFGALGEGYAADRCRSIMLAKGVKAGIVNGSGDMSTWGRKPNGQPWNIGVAHPFSRGSLYAVIPLEQEGSVVTSGSYEKYAEINGKRYAHIINPATGYPATGLTSVTIFGPSAEQANGFSTSVMVLGKKKGKRLLKKFPDYSYIMVTDKGKFIHSKSIPLKKYLVKADS